MTHPNSELIKLIVLFEQLLDGLKEQLVGNPKRKV
jgi:hypothetical protein